MSNKKMKFCSHMLCLECNNKNSLDSFKNWQPLQENTYKKNKSQSIFFKKYSPSKKICKTLLFRGRISKCLFHF